ncbi:MAG: ribonuclease R [Proteobacteria bacterium]|jgi:ribonuclease R|nr:ribonuclease R [Pseudomonadota bacterium]
MSKKKKPSHHQDKINTTTKTCIYHRNKNGFAGTAIEISTNIHIDIRADRENFALDNDEVEVSCSSDKIDRWSGSIIKIIKHNTKNLIGTIITHDNKYFLRVSNPKFGNYLVLANNVPSAFKPDELFHSIISEFPTSANPYFTVQIVSSIGSVEEDKAFITQTIIEANLPVEFSKKALEQAESIPDKISAKDLKDRTDLRELPFVTIDGEDAKDFDDAVYCEYQDETFTLYVAIADVAHYVTHESSLDIDAYQRGTSVYFPRRVIPMLPEKLSNGLCSLNPKVDRLVICCKMQIDTEGNIDKYEVFNAVINSSARLTYNLVQSYIENISSTPKELAPNISNLYLVFKTLLKSRAARGAIDFETEEPYFSFDKDGVVDGIHPRVRLDAHKLIEECMLAANVSIANFMVAHKQPCLFRIHDKPSEEKFNNLKAYLNSLAIKFEVPYAQLSPQDYATLLTHVHDNEQFPAIQQTVLRSMQLAIYSPTNIGHFGLSYERYLHFTSPIRRYPDLLTHRAIKKILQSKMYEYATPIEAIGEQTSFNERRAEDLERKVDSFYKCQYAKTHVGSVFKGMVTSIVNFGLFIYIPDLMLDGLLHVTELGNDFFVFDEKKQVLVGKRSGLQYHNGQELMIEIAHVDMTKLFIDFCIAESDSEQDKTT